MMNKLKFLLLLVLCVGVFGGASCAFAQGDGKVLVSAGGSSLKQSDVDQLIKFYEWAFQTEFSSVQRGEYRQIKEAEFRRTPAEAKKGNDNLIGFLPKIFAKSASEQDSVRSAYNADFIPSLREATGDAEAQFLLGVYDAAHNGGGNGGRTVGESESANDGRDAVGDLSSVVGKWVWQNSGSGTWNSGTGAYMGGSGTRTTYQFAADGSVVYTGIMNTMMGGCSQQVFLKQTGRATLSGNTMTIKWAPGTSTRDYSCDKAGNYTKTAPALTEKFPISFKTNSTGQRLFCMNSGSKETCYSPLK